MGFTPGIILFGMGLLTIVTLYRDEMRGAAIGRINRYVPISARDCAPDAYRAAIRRSIAASLLWRLAVCGVFGLVLLSVLAGRPVGVSGQPDALLAMSMLERIVLWVSGSMILLSDRAYAAMH